jgi:hypothetical protein
MCPDSVFLLTAFDVSSVCAHFSILQSALHAFPGMHLGALMCFQQTPAPIFSLRDVMPTNQNSVGEQVIKSRHTAPVAHCYGTFGHDDVKLPRGACLCVQVRVHA